MPSVGNCNNIVNSAEKACETLACPGGLTDKELMKAIGIVLCSLNSLVASSIEINQSLPDFQTYSRGIDGERFTSADQSAAVADITDGPTSGQKLVITDLLISSDADMRLDFNVEDDPTVIESIYIGANSSMQFTPRGKWKLPTADKKLQVQSSAAGNISITAFYYSEA